MRPAALALALLAAPATALAQAQPAPAVAAATAPTQVLIAAEHTARVAPDRAVITLGVVAQGATAQAASQAQATRMTAVMQSLRRARIAERDVQTASLMLNPQYRYEENQPPQLVAYEAQNTVTIRVRDLSQLGRVMDAAVAAGGNQVQGVSFEVEEPEQALNEARRQAFAKARARAELYAQAAGMQVGRIVSISEGGGFAPPPPMPMARMAMMEAQAASTPVSPGEVPLTATVNVVYELR